MNDKLKQIKEAIDDIEIELERLRQQKLELERTYWDQVQASGGLCVCMGKMEY